MQLVQEGSPSKTPQKRSAQGRKMVLVSDCPENLKVTSAYIETITKKRGLSVITRADFHVDSLQDFKPGDVGIVTISNVKKVTIELEMILRKLTNDEYRDVHIIIPASASRETPVVAHIRTYFPTLKPSQRVWHGLARFHQEITRLIPA